MEIDKIIKGIEKGFSKGSGIITLAGYKDINELNEIKLKFESNGYHCNLRHELYIHEGVWPYQLTISKPVKFKFTN